MNEKLIICMVTQGSEGKEGEGRLLSHLRDKSIMERQGLRKHVVLHNECTYWFRVTHFQKSILIYCPAPSPLLSDRRLPPWCKLLISPAFRRFENQRWRLNFLRDNSEHSPAKSTPALYSILASVPLNGSFYITPILLKLQCTGKLC